MENLTWDELLDTYESLKQNLDKSNKQLSKSKKAVEDRRKEIQQLNRKIEEIGTNKEQYIRDNFEKLKKERIKVSLKSLAQKYEDSKRYRESIIADYKQKLDSDIKVDYPPELEQIWELLDIAHKITITLNHGNCKCASFILRNKDTVDVAPDLYGSTLSEILSHLNEFRQLINYINDFDEKSPLRLDAPLNASPGVQLGVVALGGATFLANIAFPFTIPLVGLAGCAASGSLAYMNNQNTNDLMKVVRFLRFAQDYATQFGRILFNYQYNFQNNIKKGLKEALAKDLKEIDEEINRYQIQYKEEGQRLSDSFDDETFKKELSESYERDLQRTKDTLKRTQNKLSTEEKSLATEQEVADIWLEKVRTTREEIEMRKVKPTNNSLWWMPSRLFYNFNEEGVLSSIPFDGHSLGYVYKDIEDQARFDQYKNNEMKFESDLASGVKDAKDYEEFLSSQKKTHAWTIITQLLANVNRNVINIYIIDKKNAGRDYTSLLKLPNIKLITTDSTVDKAKANAMGLTDLFNFLQSEMKNRQQLLATNNLTSIKEYNQLKQQTGSRPMPYHIVLFCDYDDKDLTYANMSQLIINSDELGLIPIFFLNYDRIIGSYKDACVSVTQNPNAHLKELPNGDSYMTVLQSFEGREFVIYANKVFGDARPFQNKASGALKKFLKPTTYVDECNIAHMYAGEYAELWYDMYKYLKDKKSN